MKLIFFLTVFIVISSCTSLDSIRTANRKKISKIDYGMSISEVTHIMGEEEVVAEGDTIPSPYKQERMVDKAGKKYTVLFYYSDRKKADGVITDDELTPIVLKDGKVDGIGWQYFNINKDLGINSEKIDINLR